MVTIGPSVSLAANGDVGLQRIDATGALLDSEPAFSAADAMNESIAVGGVNGESIVAFSDRPGFDQDIRGVRFDATGQATGAAFDLSLGRGRQSYVTSVDGPGDENLVVYVSQVSGETRIMSQRVADDGTVIDAEPMVVAVEPATIRVVPQVAWNGSVYLLTWGNVAQRVSASNQVLGTPIVVSNLPTRTVAAANDTFIVGSYESYVLHEITRYRIYFSRIASDGTLLDSTPILIDGGAPGNMSAASFGDQVVFAYSPSKAVLIGDDASMSAPIFYSNSSASSTDVTVHGDQAFFVYATSNSAPNEASNYGAIHAFGWNDA